MPGAATVADVEIDPGAEELLLRQQVAELGRQVLGLDYLERLEPGLGAEQLQLDMELVHDRTHHRHAEGDIDRGRLAGRPVHRAVRVAAGEDIDDMVDELHVEPHQDQVATLGPHDREQPGAPAGCRSGGPAG